MRKLISIMTMMAALFLGTVAASAADHGTKQEAQAMTEHAAAFLKANGKEKAFAAFDNGTDGFKDRDLYVYVYGLDGTCVAHGANAAMIGKHLIDLKDVDGKPLVHEIVAAPESGAWIEFKWKNPLSGDVQAKTAYNVKVGDVVIGVGAYAPSN